MKKQEYPGLEFLFQRTISVQMLLFALTKVKRRYPFLAVPDCSDILSTEKLSTQAGIIDSGLALQKIITYCRCGFYHFIKS